MSSRRRRWNGLSSVTGALLEMSPDENSCLDFKENINPLNAEYRAMMANAAALAEERHATVLVGVAEKTDARTGTTSGQIIGLTGNLHQTALTVANRSSETEPTPIGIDVFEENVGSKPILRVEITPTMPPHYDRKGRRATRQGTSTRAMSDEEILRLLEARQRRRHAGVAEDTANLMVGNFRVVSDEVLDMAVTIDRIARVVEEGAGATQDVRDRMDELWSAVLRVATPVACGEGRCRGLGGSAPAGRRQQPSTRRSGRPSRLGVGGPGDGPQAEYSLPGTHPDLASAIPRH